jgi:hypothetical protein
VGSVIRSILHWLGDRVASDAERAYSAHLRRRPRLDDEAFLRRFYAGSGLPEDIPIRLRRLYQEIFGEDFAGLHPEDNVARIYDGIDFADVLWRVEREFRVKIHPETDLKAPFRHEGKPCSPNGTIDGTFDSVVRYLAEALRRKQSV